MMDRNEFARMLEMLVKAAKSNIKSLDLVTLTNGEYVVATCKNDYKYQIRVEGDSLLDMAYDVIDFLRFK